tara:strand:- start:842 stop:2095 length:1254 start_codon:yes stop_codon:yes gene_type:complete
LDKKIKVLVLSDHPLSPSGVGTQTRYVIEALLKTGKFQFVCLGGAVKHNDYKPQKTEEWGDDWVIFPIDGYGTPDSIRSILRQQRPDILWFMTDPRFYTWLWEMEHEVRPLVPMVYYHVWDNFPHPLFNAKYYDSNDVIATISKVTDEVVKVVSPDVDRHYIPHAVNSEVFKKLDSNLMSEFRKQNLEDENKFVFFWNNRNARRKLSGTLIYWFKDFLEIVGKDKAMLLMHTDTKDPYGQDLDLIVKQLNLDKGQVMFSREKIAPEQLSMLYNMADCTVNIADAEGFGLATLESLSCETPIIVNMTGGLQEQVTDGNEFFGIGLTPASKAIIGSQDVPYIYEDRLSKESVVNAMLEMFNKTKEEREELGKKGRNHVMKNYNFEDFNQKWTDVMLEVHEKYGSWENRKNYKSWEMIKI